jgi:hypothetical protein
MRPLFGPRTVVEAAFLVAVPVIALEVGLSWPAIVGAGAIAYLLVLAVEGALWREGKRGAAQPPAAVVQPETPAPGPEHVRVLRPEPEPAPEPAPVPEPVLDAVPVLEPAPVPVAAPPRLAPVPDPVPVLPPPALEPEPQPELPPAATVTRIGATEQWNVWDLEQLAREHAGGDPIVDEERTFLLMYLRDFAGPDGLLPADFDALVRQSFGGLVANR